MLTFILVFVSPVHLSTKTVCCSFSTLWHWWFKGACASCFEEHWSWNIVTCYLRKEFYSNRTVSTLGWLYPVEKLNWCQKLAILNSQYLNYFRSLGFNYTKWQMGWHTYVFWRKELLMALCSIVIKWTKYTHHTQINKMKRYIW